MTITAPRKMELAIRDEQAALKETRGGRLSDMDDYGHITAAIEEAQAAEKDIGKLIKELWTNLKDRDTDAVDAILQRLGNVLYETTSRMASATAEVYRAREVEK